MNISKEVINKIKEEDKKHRFNEYGGYLVIENDEITDIVFDVQESTSAHVTFGVEKIMKLPKEKRNHTRGWFHKHSIIGLSQEDVMTTMNLTKFWGECYTLVLQPNNNILCIKTVKGTDFIFRKMNIVETERKEVQLYEQPKGFLNRLIQKSV